MPCGSSGLANVFANIWVDDVKYQKVLNALENVPKLIISGSSSKLTKMQIERLKIDSEIDNTYFIPLSANDILKDDYEQIVQRIFDNFGKNNIVVVHASQLSETEEELNSALIDAELTKDTFAAVISDFLAKICEKVANKVNPVFITIGGETTYKCCKVLNSSNLLLIDEVTQAIPLCVDKNSHWIVSKSGNLGNSNTLIDIIKYFGQYE